MYDFVAVPLVVSGMSGGNQPSDGESEVEEVPLTTAFRPPVTWTNLIQIPFQVPWGIKNLLNKINKT